MVVKISWGPSGAHGSRALPSIQSSHRGDILNASDEQLDNISKFLTKLNYHVGFNDEVRALGDLPYDWFRTAYTALRYLSLGDDKTELQVEKFMNHHCGSMRLSIAVHLVTSGYWVTPTHIDFGSVKEIYKQYAVLNGQPYRPRIVEDNMYGGSSSSSSPMPAMS